MNKQNLSELYDLLYECADLLFKKYNPCKIKDGKCIAYKRLAPDNCCYIVMYQGIGKCVYLSKKGCRAKALPCKLYFCFRDEAIVSEEFRIKLQLLKDLHHAIFHWNHPIFDEYRKCKKEFLAHYQI